MKNLIVISLTIPFVLFFSCQDKQEPESTSRDAGTHRLSLEHDGLEREYVVYIPQNFDENRTYPLIVVFHGGGGQAEEVIESDNWLPLADEIGFIAVFPEGSRADMDSPASFTNNSQSWNDGSARENVGAVVRQVDDVGFIQNMILQLQDTLSIEPSAMFATGFSNGASMTFRLARELPGLFEAVAPVAGSDWMQDLIPASTPPRILYITGTEDPLNPFEGGDIYLGNTYLGTKPDVKEMILEWTVLLDCETGFTTSTQEDIRTYQFDCSANDQLKMLALLGHGHHWPGAPSSLPVSVVGENTSSLNANEVIWEFFDK